MGRIPLAQEEYGYASMTRIGKIEVKQTDEGELAIIIEGFEFDDLPTCRMSTVRAMAWLRDILDNQVGLQKLVNAQVYSVAN